MNKKPVLIGIAVALGIGAGLIARQMMHRTSSSETSETASSGVNESTSTATTNLPPLEESEAGFRVKAADLSKDAGWAEWLKSENLLRRAAASIDNIAAGKIPRDALTNLAPHKKFPLKRMLGGLYADPAGYARYDKTTEVFASVDALAAAQLIKDTRPLFEQACREFGGSACEYPGSFVRAAGHLLETPVTDKLLRLKPAEKGVVYVYEDETLERLSPAQKQLMRMGPKNQAQIQTKLREILMGLGVPEADIPKPAP